MTSTSSATPSARPEAASGRTAIEAVGLHKTYPGDVRALDGLSISVEAGSVFALLGPNGSGKTTTVRILTTLSRADSGDARVAGIDVLANPKAVRHAIGCVAQHSGVDGDATGRENLALQGRVHGLSGAELNGRVTELLGRFRLDEAADRLARTYSGGMRRKLDLAMGLVHQPSVLFLDEPTTGLDPEARAELWQQIELLSAEQGLTVLLTTHYLEEADQLAARVAIMDRGRIVVEGSPDELKSELRGDALQVELSQVAPEDGVRAALDRVPGVREVTIADRLVRARADEGSAAVPAVLAALEAAEVPVASVTVSRPSLDDVYLRHTGRSLAEAHADEQKKEDAR